MPEASSRPSTCAQDGRELVDLLGGERIEHQAAHGGDVPGSGRGEHGEPLVGELGQGRAPVVGARDAPDPAVALEPRDGVRQPALRALRDLREVAHPQRAPRDVGQHREDLVVGVRHPGVALELAVQLRVEQGGHGDVGHPGVVLRVGEPPVVVFHAPSLPES
jgi:hypothetical protein